LFLDPLNPQSALSPAILDLTEEMIANDRDYRGRLVRHYAMWKRIVEDAAESLRASDCWRTVLLDGLQ
jgi:hypothetical protein